MRSFVIKGDTFSWFLVDQKMNGFLEAGLISRADVLLPNSLHAAFHNRQCHATGAEAYWNERSNLNIS